MLGLLTELDVCDVTYLIDFAELQGSLRMSKEGVSLYSKPWKC